MPCLKILTNLPRSKIPSDFVDRIMPTLAKAVNKPEDKFVCVITGDCQISISGDSKAPGATASLESIGHLGPEENKAIVRDISEYIHRELKIEPNRLFISLYDINKHFIGKGGITAAEMNE